MLILTQFHEDCPSAYIYFVTRFGIKCADTDTDLRRNNILLQFIKWCLKNGYHEYAKSTHASEIYPAVLRILGEQLWKMNMNRTDFTVSDVPLSNDKMICVNSWGKPLHDGGLYTDPTRIRYYDQKTERILIGRPARWIMYVINKDEITATLPEQVKNYFGEQFASMWLTYCNAHSASTLRLKYGKDAESFKRIYSSNDQRGNFHSCMTDDDRQTYYQCVDATAAWLEDDDGMMVARCVIFNNVKVIGDDTKHYRLAERQYASDDFYMGNSYIDPDKLKRVLVDMLIKENLIDGYKSIGVDCHAITSYHSNDGTLLPYRERLYIDVDTDKLLKQDGVTSYQDTFIYLSPSRKAAYNNEYKPYKYRLDTNDDDIIPYDEYNQEYTFSYCVDVIDENGNCRTCSEDKLDDFVYEHDRYIHKDYLSHFRREYNALKRESREEAEEWVMRLS